MRARPGVHRPSMPMVTRDGLPLGLRWERVDRHCALAPLAVVGLLAAAVLVRVGLPPVNLARPAALPGVMHPLCGITRGMVAVLGGQLGQAWAYHPLPVRCSWPERCWRSVAGWSAG
jgi:Protein of unknown function (DUF2752)